MTSAPSTGRSSVPLWTYIAGLLSAAVGVFGALASWQGQIEVQRQRNQNDLLLKLIDADPLKSQQNLLFFSEAGILNLDAATVEKLKKNPYLAPTSANPAPTGDAADPVPAPAAAPTAADPDAIEQLVSDLNSSNANARVAAGQQLTTAYAKSPQAIDALLKSLEGPQLDRLSANGRINVISVLTAMDGWTGEQKTQAKSAIEVIDQRAPQQQIGAKTGAALNRLRDVVEAPSP